ncbi:MAG: hypothetical protein UZ08_BCD001001497 [Candidatus Parvibacillus calidus]|nr:MAG: hypothetical protein UZ08_BCD001001497 [Candidatus Parvibacillus calidus]
MPGVFYFHQCIKAYSPCPDSAPELYALYLSTNGI